MTDSEKWEQIKMERNELFVVLKRMATFVSHHIQADQRKNSSKTGYPYFFSRKFISKAGNKKFLVVKISNKKALKDFMHDINYSIRSYTLLDSGAKGIYVYNDVPQTYDRLEIYIPHYWSRYRERMNLGDDVSFYDLLVYHYHHNCVYSMRMRDIPTLKQHKNGFFATSGDGISLGIKYPENIYKFNTFITTDMMKGEEQMAAFLVDEVRRILAENQTIVPPFYPVNYGHTIIEPVKRSLVEIAIKKRENMKLAIQRETEKLKEEIVLRERERSLWFYRVGQYMVKLKMVLWGVLKRCF